MPTGDTGLINKSDALVLQFIPKAIGFCPVFAVSGGLALGNEIFHRWVG